MAQIQCELNIIRLTNLDTYNHSAGKLFIRYFVYVGGGRRIRIDTREIQCTSDARWDEESSMECSVPSISMEEAICEHKVVFELRWRKAKAVFGAKAKSKLLGRTEVAWNDALGSNDISVEKRMSLAMKRPVADGLKPPSLLLRMGIRVRDLPKNEKRGKNERSECRCESCRWIGSDEDMFVAANNASMINVW